MSTITLVPFGGLGNRIRSIASAYYLCQCIGSNLKVIWFADRGLGARFNDIFIQPDDGTIDIIEATKRDFFVNGIPCVRNVWISSLFIKARYDAVMNEGKMRPDSSFSFENWAKGRDVWWATCHRDIDYPSEVLASLFVPSSKIQCRVKEITSAFSENTIGVHIRRTDNHNSIRYSPDSLFFEQLNRQIERKPNTCIFLATDSDYTKALFAKKYGKRVVTSEKTADRSTVQGIEEALAEMYSLANTRLILGSYYSSFSEVASEIGGRELRILKLDE